MTTTDTQVQELVINTLTKQEYEAIQNPSDTELYMVTDDLLANFIGADGTNAGVAGLVPPPQTTDNTKFLKGNGSWSNIALSSSDITNALGYTPQNSSTAVTHNANTQMGSGVNPIYISSTGAVLSSGSTVGSGVKPVFLNAGAITVSASTVGNSTTPVYLSSGTITSTGLSIASSRFDGQWVLNYHWDISTASGTGTTSINISSYLPDTTNSYEIMVYASCAYSSNSAGMAIGTASAPYDHGTSCYKGRVYVTTNARQAHVTVILPVGTSRTIYCQRTASVNDAHVTFIGYRRIGTNT